jgi:uncharacterized protein YcfL
MAVIAGAAVAAMLGGCVSNRKKDTSGIEGTAGGGIAPDGAPTQSKFVIVNNKRLARGIQVVDLGTARTANDLLRAWVTIVSKYNKTLMFQYKFSWFDAQGMEIDPEARAWIPVTLYGNETKTLQATAPTSAATKFKIKIRAH